MTGKSPVSAAARIFHGGWAGDANNPMKRNVQTRSNPLWKSHGTQVWKPVYGRLGSLRHLGLPRFFRFHWNNWVSTYQANSGRFNAKKVPIFWGRQIFRLGFRGWSANLAA